MESVVKKLDVDKEELEDYIREFFNTNNERPGDDWYTVNELISIVGKSETSIRRRLRVGVKNGTIEATEKIPRYYRIKSSGSG